MITRTGDKRIFVAEDGWTEQMSNTIQEEGITSIRLSEYAGWSDSSISFLSHVPRIEHIELWSSKVKDISVLYSLKNLKSLSIDGVVCPVDFQAMHDLSDIHIGHWRESSHKTVFSAKKLRTLAVNYYSEPDLSAFARIRGLENLAISYSKMPTVKGIGGARSLMRLSLGRVHQLISLDGVEDLKNLKLFWIEGARRLKSINSLSSLEALKTLNLTDCPSIESLRPIQDLQCLEAVWFYGTTRIKDGDLCPLAVLPRLRYSKFVDRKSYSHKSDDFPKSLDFYR